MFAPVAADTFMPAEFDPYYTWLGIPREEQPPHHYRLLGIRPLEADRDVITHAMDQRMAHLRTMQGGKHSEHSQKLLNEVSAAAVVLLDRTRKESYDATLKQQLAQAAKASPAVVPPPPPADVAPPPASILPPPPPAGIAPPQAADQNSALAMPLIAAGAVAGGVAALLLAFVMIVALWTWNTPRRVAEAPAAPASADTGHSAPGEHSAELEQNPPAISGDDAPPTAPAVPSAAAPMPPSSATAVEDNPRASAGTRPQPSLAESPAAAAPAPAPTNPVERPLPQPSAPQPEPPAAQPTPAEIDAARTKVAEIYGGEARQALTPEQKLALAHTMIQTSHETTNDPAARYALLDAARRLLAAAGDADLALATIDELAGEFDEDPQALQLSTFSAMSDAQLPAPQRDRLAAVLVNLIDRAVAGEEFTAADELARLAVKVSSRTSDASLRRAILHKRSELTRLKDEFQKVQQARQKLAADERDPAANLVIGRFLCFSVANFDEGVPYLAQSGKEPFAGAALADQAAQQAGTRHLRDLPPGAGSADTELKAGDAWYALAESVKSSDKELLPGALVRTRHWYELALPQLSGLDKARVEKRLAEIASSGIAPRPAEASGKFGKSSTKAKAKGGKRKNKGNSPPAQPPTAQ